MSAPLPLARAAPPGHRLRASHRVIRPDRPAPGKAGTEFRARTDREHDPAPEESK
jgi:hypothetical protein